MRIRLATSVQMSPERVRAGFDESLFMRLAPPLPRLRLLRFDGCETGDLVEVEINFVFFKQRWRSTIVDHGSDGHECWFVDEGTQLPFFLRFWRHEHRIQTRAEGSLIVDDIEFRSPNRLMDWLLYPSLWLQFAYRRPIYRRVFGPPGSA